MSFQSIITPEALWAEPEEAPMELCPCPYGQLEGCRDAAGRFVVRRILSTDPAAYLDSRYAPGAVLQIPRTETA